MQEIAVYFLVLGSMVYLARRAWLRLKAGEGGNCPGCGGCGKPEPQKLIQLSTVPRRKPPTS